jgi:biopolymer transport protein ExbD
MIGFRRTSRPPAPVDLTPLIDVVFQLLVFFLLTSAFINPGISVQLPDAETGERSDDVGISISVDRDGRVFIEQDEIPLEELESYLLAAASGDPDVPVAIWGDAGVPYGTLVEILDTCRKAALTNVVLMVRRGE